MNADFGAPKELAGGLQQRRALYQPPLPPCLQVITNFHLIPCDSCPPAHLCLLCNTMTFVVSVLGRDSEFLMNFGGFMGGLPFLIPLSIHGQTIGFN